MLSRAHPLRKWAGKKLIKYLSPFSVSLDPKNKRGMIRVDIRKFFNRYVK